MGKPTDEIQMDPEDARPVGVQNPVDPETGIQLGIGEDTGLPTTVGTGNVVDAHAAGSDVVDDAGSKGDPAYDPDFVDFTNGALSPPGEIEMDGTNVSQEQAEGRALSIKEGQKASASYRGVTDDGIKESDKLFGPARERAAAQQSAMADQYNADASRLIANNDNRKAALEALAAKEEEHFTNMAEIRRQQMDLNFKAQRAEELAAVQAHKNADQYIANYKQEIAGIRPLLMQSGNPLGGLTTIQGGAMGAALFAQGFLGARYGIKIDVAGQLSRWVDQEMQAHQNKITNMQNLANSQLTLYNLARQQGLDDQLTRDRLHGFAIDAMKSSIYMEAARYQSASALANAKVKMAELDQLSLKNEMDMRDNLVKNQMQVARDEIAAAHAQGSLSMEGWSRALEQQRQADIRKNEDWARKRTDRKDAMEENAPPPDESWAEIGDPGKPVKDDKGNTVGYETTWSYDTNTPKEILTKTVADVNEHMAMYDEGLKGLDSVRTYMEQHPDALKRNLRGDGFLYDNAENREVRRRIEAAFMNARHAMFGAALTAQEAPRFEQFYGEDYLFQRGSNGTKALDDFENMMRNRMESSIESRQGVKLNPKPGIKRVDSRLNTTKARMGVNDAPDAVQTPGEEAAGRATGIDRSKPAGNASQNYLDFIAKEGSPTVEFGDKKVPSLTASDPNKGYSQTERAIEKMAAEVVNGLDNKNGDQIADGLKNIQVLRDKGNQYAGYVLDTLKKRYPQLSESPQSLPPPRQPVARPNDEEPAPRVPMRLKE